MTEPQHQRISDADRHQVAEILREAAGEGRIDLEELDERLEAAYAAKTYADLVPITLDLPSGPGVPTVPARVEGAAVAPAWAASSESSSASSQKFVAIMGGLERTGVWEVPERMVVTCFMGGADLDLREATFAAREVTITVNAIMGGAQITVGPDVQVIVEGMGIMGGFSAPSGVVEGAPGPDALRLRIKGFAIMGGVSVERKHGRS